MKSGWIRLMVLCGTLAAGLPALAADENPDNEIWRKVRLALFQDRAIEDGAGVIELDAPVRAEDAAVVPLSIRAREPQSAQRYIEKIYLVIDRNPSPVAAVFSLSPESGRADLETRVRIEEYTFVRAIAAMNDGRLHMARRYVKASGGCSAPAGKDPLAALARLGKMKLRLDQALAPGQPNLAQLMVSHPNNSGLVMDQLTRLYEPAYFVRRIEVSYAGRPILSADVDFSISENPNLRFYFVPRGEGELKAEVVDTKDLKFESSIRLKRDSASSS